MKKYLLLTMVFFLITPGIYAQVQVHEEDLVKNTINKLFDGMRNGDSTLTRSAFANQCIMQTIAQSKEGGFSVKTSSVDNFIKLIGSPHKEKFDERIIFTNVLIDGNLASVWTDYKFYTDNKFSHCGVNSFQLFKDKTGWKIVYIIDTRRKDGCNP